MKRRSYFKIVIIISALLLSFTQNSYAGQLPKTLKFALVLPAGVENAWSTSLINSLERVKASKPHGVNVEFAHTENVWGEKGLAVLDAYAESGEYDIIWGHGSFADDVERLQKQYPDQMFVLIGSGNRALGGNSYLLYMHIHEAAYALGVLAGSITKSNILGVVGLFPADDVNDQVNAFRAGAVSVNSKTKVKVTFIESWYDPAKAAEAANAQIAAGADMIYQLGESFQTCKEKAIYCFGNYIDMNEVAPEVVPTSSLVFWEPQINYVIDEWKNFKTSGKPYDAPQEVVWFGMSDGGSDIAPYHNFDGEIPADAKAKVAKVLADFKSGALTIPLDMSLPKSD